MPVFQTPRAAEYLELLKERLPDKTLRHVRSVAEHIVTVAEEAGVDRHRAVAAALLHDLCKAMPADDLLRRAQKYGLSITDAQKTKPSLLHGPVAAEMARRKLSVEDSDIYDAIYYHTTGRPDFSRLGQVLYVADFSEPLRSFSEAGEARLVMASEGFDAALLYVSDERLAEVRKKAFVDPLTEAFNDWLHRRNGARS